MDRTTSELFKTERIAFRVDGVPATGPKRELWCEGLKATAIEARRLAPAWVGVGPLACYVRLVSPRPVVAIDLAAGAGHGTDPGQSCWDTEQKPGWAFRAVLPSLEGILWDSIRQVCFPMADVRVASIDEKAHTIVVVSELPPIGDEGTWAVDIVGLMREADSWAVREEGLRARVR